MADHLPLYGPNTAVTYTTSAAVTGGRLVAISGALTVAHTAGAGPISGVTARDAASGARVTVHAPAGVHRLLADGAIAAAGQVVAAASGAVAAYDDVTQTPDDVIGHAEEAIADTATGRIRLN